MTAFSPLCLYFSALLLGGLGAAAAGLGGLCALALEGVMIVGGLGGLLCSHLPWPLCLLVSGGAGLGFALLMIPGRRGGIFAAIALNGLAAALSMMAARLNGGVRYSRKGLFLTVAGENVTVLLPAALGCLLLLWLFVYHTRRGLKLRLFGENEPTARSAGLHAGIQRLLPAALCGLLGGMGGLAAFLALGTGWRMEWGVGGLGYMAAAAAAVGRSKPLRTMLLAGVFTLARYGADTAAAAMNWPEGSVSICVFLLALTVLALWGGRGRAGIVNNDGRKWG